MSAEWCMEERCQHRHWRSGSMPTHRRGEDCPQTARERVARAWHDGSDHADHSPFGGPLCNCDRVAERMLPMLAGAWWEGFDARWSAIGPYDHAPNPYGTGGRHVDQ